MTMELFLGSLIALTLAAVIIVLMTTQKRTEYSGSDRDRHRNDARKQSKADQNV